MCLIINHFVVYYSNPQVNYMVTVFIRLVIAVVYTLHLLSCSKCFVCWSLFQYRHCFLVGWCTNKSYVIATSDLWLFIHASNLLSLYSPSPLPYKYKEYQSPQSRRNISPTEISFYSVSTRLKVCAVKPLQRVHDFHLSLLLFDLFDICNVSMHVGNTYILLLGKADKGVGGRGRWWWRWERWGKPGCW